MVHPTRQVLIGVAAIVALFSTAGAQGRGIIRLKHGQAQNFVGDYEIGALFQEFYDANMSCLSPLPYRAHYPDVTPLDLSQPCRMLEAFFVNCSLGMSMEERDAMPPWFDGWPMQFEERPSVEEQQQCYCSGQYWTYNRACNSCLKQAGYPSFNWGWIPEEYISQQSAQYCSAKPTTNFREFLEEFKPTRTVSPTANSNIVGDAQSAERLTATMMDYFKAPYPTPKFLSGISHAHPGPYIKKTRQSTWTSTRHAWSKQTPTT